LIVVTKHKLSPSAVSGKTFFIVEAEPVNPASARNSKAGIFFF